MEFYKVFTQSKEVLQVQVEINLLSEVNCACHWAIFHETAVCLTTACKEHLQKNSVALVRERTIPTERPPPVGEVSANFCG